MYTGYPPVLNATMVGFGIIGDTVSKDPMFNFPNQSMQAGNSYDIGNLLKTNQPTIGVEPNSAGCAFKA